MEELLKQSFPTAYEFPPDSRIYNIHINSNVLLKHVELHLPVMQRELDQEWVSELQRRITQKYDKNKYYDIGTIHVANLNNTFYIVDGQHRYMILDHLLNEMITLPVHVKLYELSKDEELHELFSCVNGSKPSKIYSSTKTQYLLNSLRRYLTENYQEYLSKSSKPRCPNFNLQHLIDNIVEKDFISILNITTPEQIIRIIENLNTFYRRTSFDTWKTWKIKDTEGLVLKCYEKKPIKPFYLSIFNNYEWIDRIIFSHQQQLSYDQIPHFLINYRKNIHKSKRLAVWKKRHTTLDNGTCFVCHTKDLNFYDFECGHIVAVYWGGDTSLDNLEPICKECNLEMGVQNLLEFKQERKEYTYLQKSTIQ